MNDDSAMKRVDPTEPIEQLGKTKITSWIEFLN